ncbi:hypothetical protein [Neobacillus dielmonensis]|uniref:hypothetical protein n=1 Tax=Neobacillus dielmonensis TaxID=1347369 RepID=UPI0005A6E772|nr:hypothetical protein [Neobacillus dielmonensis]
MKLMKPQQLTETSKRPYSAERLQFVPGVWVNGKYYWLYNSTEKIIYDEGLIIKVNQEHIHSKIRFSKIMVSNHSNREKEIKIMAMHYLPNIDPDHLVFVSPTDHHIFHHNGEDVFLVNGKTVEMGISQYTNMPIWNAFTDQIWNSLETGTLKYQPMAKGPAVSIFAMNLKLDKHATSKVTTWAISGTSRNEVVSMEQALLKNRLAFPGEK